MLKTQTHKSRSVPSLKKTQTLDNPASKTVYPKPQKPPNLTNPEDVKEHFEVQVPGCHKTRGHSLRQKRGRLGALRLGMEW